MRSLWCRIVGHDPVGGFPSNRALHCSRCDQRLWFWKGQRTGFFTEPEPMSNVYVGVRWRRLIGYETVVIALAFAIWWLWR
jgi:hypothetical protein